MGVSERTQLRVPVGVEGIDRQSVLGINAPIASLRGVRLVPGMLDLLATQTVRLLDPGAITPRMGPQRTWREHTMDDLPHLKCCDAEDIFHWHI